MLVFGEEVGEVDWEGMQWGLLGGDCEYICAWEHLIVCQDGGWPGTLQGGECHRGEIHRDINRVSNVVVS